MHEVRYVQRPLLRTWLREKAKQAGRTNGPLADGSTRPPDDRGSRPTLHHYPQRRYPRFGDHRSRAEPRQPRRRSVKPQLEPKTVTELADTCDLTDARVREALDAMTDDGTVYRVDRGSADAPGTNSTSPR